MAGLLFYLVAGLSAASPMPLVNGGFEEDTAHEGLSIHVYGVMPEVRNDGEVKHAGLHSLRVQSEQPSDVAFGQELQLDPEKYYRLKSWVRTKNLMFANRKAIMVSMI